MHNKTRRMNPPHLGNDVQDGHEEDEADAHANNDGLSRDVAAQVSLAMSSLP
jgi:hypothetical protein